MLTGLRMHNVDVLEGVFITLSRSINARAQRGGIYVVVLKSLLGHKAVLATIVSKCIKLFVCRDVCFYIKDKLSCYAFRRYSCGDSTLVLELQPQELQ